MLMGGTVTVTVDFAFLLGLLAFVSVAVVMTFRFVPMMVPFELAPVVMSFGTLAMHCPHRSSVSLPAGIH